MLVGTLLAALAMAACGDAPDVDVDAPAAPETAVEQVPVDDLEQQPTDDERILALIDELRVCVAEQPERSEEWRLDPARLRTWEVVHRLMAEGEAVWPHALAVPASDPVWGALGSVLREGDSVPLAGICTKLVEPDAHPELVDETVAWLLEDAGALWENRPEEEVVVRTVFDLLDAGRVQWGSHTGRWDVVGRSAPDEVTRIVVNRAVAAPRAERSWNLGNLAGLGPDTAGTIRAILPRWEELELFRASWALLQASAGTVPEALPLVRAGLAEEGTQSYVRRERLGAARAVRTWGAAGLGVVPELNALFDGGDDEERTAAARALASLGQVDDAVVAQLVAQLDSADVVRSVGLAFFRGDRRPLLANRLPAEVVDELLSVRPELVATVAGELVEQRWNPHRATHLLRDHPVAEMPSDYVALLREWLTGTDSRLRLESARRLASDDRTRTDGLAVLRVLAEGDDPELRGPAVEALREFEAAGGRDPSSDEVAALMARLERTATLWPYADDREVLEALAALPGDLPRMSPETLDFLVERFFVGGADLIHRSERRDYGLAGLMDRYLDEPSNGSPQWMRLPELVTAMGEGALHYELRLYERLPKLEGYLLHGPEAVDEQVARIFAGLHGNADSYAKGAGTGAAWVVERLARQREWDAVIRYVGRGEVTMSPELDAVLAEPELADAVRRVLTAPRDAETELDPCRGAARLVHLLPADEVAAVLESELVGASDDDGIRVGFDAATAAVLAARRRHEPLSADVLDLLAAHGSCHAPLLNHIAVFPDQEGSAERLRRVKISGEPVQRLCATRMLLDRGVDVDDARDVVEQALRFLNQPRQHFLRCWYVWKWDRVPEAPGGSTGAWFDDVAALLARVGPEPGDAALLLPTFTATSEPVLLEPVAALGPKAVGAVPALRRCLPLGADDALWMYHFDDATLRARSRAVVRTLEAIGPAASDALPDLRVWLQRSHHPAEVARAIAAIEGR